MAGKDGARVFRKNVQDKNPTENNSRKINRLLILPEENIYSPALDPDEHWRYAINLLALPEELAIFYWDDPYRDKNFDWGQVPVYEESTTRNISGKTYECDHYVNEIKNVAGEVIAREVYTAFYEEGKLVTIEKHFIRGGITDYTVSKIKIKTITAEVPESAFAVNEKIKVYNAHNGDLNDLLENYEEIGEIGGEHK